MTVLRRRLDVAALILLAAFFVAAPVSAQFVEERLADPAQEARAYALHKQLRCLVCQNQSIVDSNADLARDLRIIVRERVGAGDSDAQVLDYMVARYGDWVLMKPPFKITTALLWLGPGLIFLLTAGGVFIAFRRGRGSAAASTPLSSEESARLDELLKDASGGGR
jgi:cytochrome c-type biogenesis protein CcmH